MDSSQCASTERPCSGPLSSSVEGNRGGTSTRPAPDGTNHESDQLGRVALAGASGQPGYQVQHHLGVEGLSEKAGGADV